MSEYTRRVVEEELRNKLDELNKMLSSSRKDFDVEREARIKAENDLKVVKYDQELQEKQIKELQEELEKEKREKARVAIAGAKMAAKCDAAEAARDAYKNAFEASVGLVFGKDDDDD